MKANTISIEADGIKIKGAPERMVQLLMAGMLAQVLPPAANVEPVVIGSTPALGEYWPGQGGLNGGLVAEHGGIPAHYLTACAELYHCWVNVPELFAKDTWYWSSSQRSANFAFTMYFGGGRQLNPGKVLVLRVRPVRRFFI
jgi:hypothetical protein